MSTTFSKILLTAALFISGFLIYKGAIDNAPPIHIPDPIGDTFRGLKADAPVGNSADIEAEIARVLSLTPEIATSYLEAGAILAIGNGELGAEIARKTTELFSYGYVYFKTPCGENLDVISYIECMHAHGADKMADGGTMNSEFNEGMTRQDFYDLAEDVAQIMADGKNMTQPEFLSNTKWGKVFRTWVKVPRVIGKSTSDGGTFQAKWVRVIYEARDGRANILRDFYPDKLPARFVEAAKKANLWERFKKLD